MSSMFSIIDCLIISTKIQGKKRRVGLSTRLLNQRETSTEYSYMHVPRNIASGRFYNRDNIDNRYAYVRNVNYQLHDASSFACNTVCHRAKIIIGREAREP